MAAQTSVSMLSTIIKSIQNFLFEKEILTRLFWVWAKHSCEVYIGNGIASSKDVFQSFYLIVKDTRSIQKRRPVIQELTSSGQNWHSLGISARKMDAIFFSQQWIKDYSIAISKTLTRYVSEARMQMFKGKTNPLRKLKIRSKFKFPKV